jgi:predicted enzyme related to lactoylglutathione lyase
MANTETIKRNWTNWFEIPVSNLQRAKTFYEIIFNTQIEILDFGELKMGIFPHNEVGCALCQHEAYVPSVSGLLVYLDASPDLNLVLNKVENADGKILKSKTEIAPGLGYMALFIDTEGNRLAINSML